MQDNFILLEEVKHFLKIDHTEDDKILLQLIQVAAEYATNFLKFSPDPKRLPSSIKQGMLMHINFMYDQGNALEGVPESVLGLYRPFRKITL